MEKMCIIVIKCVQNEINNFYIFNISIEMIQKQKETERRAHYANYLQKGSYLLIGSDLLIFRKSHPEPPCQKKPI